MNESFDHDPRPSAELTWSFPPLINPPQRVGEQFVLNHGMHTAPGWEVAWAQVVGPRHRISEDSLATRYLNWPTSNRTNQMGIIAALADGVGGGARGDVASHAIAGHCTELPIEYCDQITSAPEGIRNWLLLGDGVVGNALQAVSPRPGAATLAAIWLDSDGQGWITRVGDARIYLVDQTPAGRSTGVIATGGKGLVPEPLIECLMPDQTYANLGEAPPQTGLEDEPARMVGAGLVGNPELLPIHLNQNQVLLLCSDGLHRWMDDTDMAAIAGTKSELEAAACALASHARAHGSDDDISVLLVRRLALVATQS